MRQDEARLMAALDGLGIRTTRYDHPAVFSVAESEKIDIDIPGAHTKNLFLKDKKGQFWLATVGAQRVFRIRALEKALGARGCSFGKPEALRDILGVAPGSVTTLAAINDPDHRVKIVLDAALLRAERINLHPLRNDATLSISPEGLRRFLDHTGHDWRELDFDPLEAEAAAVAAQRDTG